MKLNKQNVTKLKLKEVREYNASQPKFLRANYNYANKTQAFLTLWHGWRKNGFTSNPFSCNWVAIAFTFHFRNDGGLYG
jgi:hypothetical protein